MIAQWGNSAVVPRNQLYRWMCQPQQKQRIVVHVQNDVSIESRVEYPIDYGNSFMYLAVTWVVNDDGKVAEQLVADCKTIIKFPKCGGFSRPDPTRHGEVASGWMEVERGEMMENPRFIDSQENDRQKAFRQVDFRVNRSHIFAVKH